MAQHSQNTETVVDLLIEDHREFDALFEKAKSTTDHHHRRDLADQIIADLVRHSVAEEQYLYPAVRAYLTNGDQRADHEIAEHAEAEEMMKGLENVDAEDPRLLTMVSGLHDTITHHVSDEENDIFPALQQTMDHASLVELGTKVHQAKAKAPTRPHPDLPRTPPLNKVVGPGTGFVDRLRDHLSGREV